MVSPTFGLLFTCTQKPTFELPMVNLIILRNGPCGRASRSQAKISDIVQKKRKHININKFAGLSRDWAGGRILFMCFFRVTPYGDEKHINKIPPKIPGQSRENFVYVFFLYVFFAPQWLGCGSDVPRMSLGRVFGCGRKSLAEVKGKRLPASEAQKSIEHVNCKI